MISGKKIGLAVLNYNSSEKIVNAIKKIVLYKSIDNIIIVDNKSTDNSWSVLNELSKYDRVDVVESGKNGGWSYGYNIACRQLKQKHNVDYIAVMTPANSFEEDTLIKLAEALEGHREYALLAPIQKDQNGKLTDRIGWRRPTYIECLLDTSVFFRKAVRKRSSIFITAPEEDGIIPVQVVGGAFYVIRADVLEEIGYYDEDIFLYHEENVLSVKLEKKGYMEGVLTTCEFFHEQRYGTKKNLTKITGYKMTQASKYVLASKYMNLSNFKLMILKSAIAYGTMEKRIVDYIFHFFKDKNR